MLLPVDQVRTSLQPYPNLPGQEKVVKTTTCISDAILKISSIVCLPFNLIGKVFGTVASIKNCCHKSEPILQLEGIPGDSIPPVYLKSYAISFDNNFYYIIQDGFLWFKPLAAHQDSDWRILGSTGNPSKVPLKGVSADGNDIIVIDEENKIWYAKTNQINVIVSFDCPTWEIVSMQISWTSSWYNMPIIAGLVNLFKDPTLQVPADARVICISHKGVETLYYTDMSGKRIVDALEGTTTIYILADQIYLADPWMGNHFANVIPCPEDGRFIADNMEASASTLMVVQHGLNMDGKQYNVCYTRYIEMDELLTMYPHTYDINNHNPLVRFFPPEPWTKQPEIILIGDAKLINVVTVLQTGQGQEHRELRWTGCDYHGVTGYYYKNIYDLEWKFQKTNQLIPKEAFTVPADHRGGLRLNPIMTRDYSCEYTSDFVKNVALRRLIPANIVERTPSTVLELVLKNHHRYTLVLHQLKGFKYLLGLSKEDDKWQLIAPVNTPDVSEYKRAHEWLTGGLPSVPVQVTERANRINIAVQGKFDLEFTMIEPTGRLLCSQLRF